MVSFVMMTGLGMFLMASTEPIFPVTVRSPVSQMVASAKDSNEIFCHANATKKTYSPQCKIAQESSLNPLIVLGVSEFIMGLGATSIVILALPFIDDNVATRNSPYYFGKSSFLHQTAVKTSMSPSMGKLLFSSLVCRPITRPFVWIRPGCNLHKHIL